MDFVNGQNNLSKEREDKIMLKVKEKQLNIITIQQPHKIY